MSKIIVLYSGGLDSAVVLAEAIHNRHDVLALSIDYGQTNGAELLACRRLAATWGFPHKVVTVNLEAKDPQTEVPARNVNFIAKALEQAVLLRFDAICYGAEPEDVYLDSTNEFIAAMDKVTLLHGVKLMAPLKRFFSHREVFSQALALGIPLDLVHSSRTNEIDGACKTSKKFLQRIEERFPGEDPVKLLGRLSAFHSAPIHESNLESSMARLSFLTRRDAEKSGMIVAAKQALSHYVRPAYRRRPLRRVADPIVSLAMEELGY